MLHKNEFDSDLGRELSEIQDILISESDDEQQTATPALVDDVYLYHIFPLLDAVSIAHLALADKKYYALAEKYMGKDQFGYMLSISLLAEKLKLLSMMKVELSKMIDAKVDSLKIEKKKDTRLERSTKIDAPLGIGVLIGMAVLVYFVFPQNISQAHAGADFNSRKNETDEMLRKCSYRECFDPYTSNECYTVHPTVCGDLFNADSCGIQVAEAARALSKECSKSHLLTDAILKLTGTSVGLITITIIYGCIFGCLRDADNKISRDTVTQLNFNTLDLSLVDAFFKDMVKRLGIKEDFKIYSVENMLDKIYYYLNKDYKCKISLLPSELSLLPCSFFKTYKPPMQEVVIDIANESTPLLKND